MVRESEVRKFLTAAKVSTEIKLGGKMTEQQKQLAYDRAILAGYQDGMDAVVQFFRDRGLIESGR